MATIKETIATNPIHSALSLLDAEAYCGDVCVVLTKIKDLLNEMPSSTCTAAREMKSLLNLLLKAVPFISKTVRQQASACVPSGTNPKYTWSRRQQSSNPCRHTGRERLKVMIDEAIAASKKEKQKCKTSSPVANNQTRVRASKRKISTPAVVSPAKGGGDISTSYPVPINNKHFTIKEAVNAYKDCSPQFKKQKMIAYWEDKGWVPHYKGGTRHWNRMIQNMEKGRELREWSLDKDGKFCSDLKVRAGATPKVLTSQIEKYIDSVPNGETLDAKHARTMITSAIKERDEQKGLYHNPRSHSCCEKTVKNYTSAQLSYGSTITEKAVRKTEARQTAENSLRSAISFLICTAFTMFQVGPLQAGREPLSAATEGAKEFFKLVSGANNNLEVRPLYPQNIHSTDDSGHYHVVGVTEKDECQWRIVKNDGEKNSTKSIYNPCKKSMLIGQRIRLTWTISADGTVAAVYMSVLGLNARELPVDTCPSGVLVLPIEGLAVGGVNPDCKTLGYVAFVRAGKDLEKENFRNYQKMVARPYIMKKKNIPEGTSPTEEQRSVSWSDGGGAQLGALLEENSLNEADQQYLTLCKHSASRTAVEQFCDTSPVFKNVNRNMKTITAKKLPRSTGFKKIVFDQIEELHATNHLNLSDCKKECICDFLICVPNIMTQSVNPSDITKGFIVGGAIDEETKTWPDFQSILDTCRRKLSKEELDSIKTNFNTYYDAFASHGRIPEELFDQLGVVEDVDRNGNIKQRRNQAIVNQRAMCYSSHAVRQARTRQLQQQANLERIQKLDKDNKVKDWLENNKSCESKLGDLKSATMKDFAGTKKDGPLAPELEAFIHVRLFATPNIPRNFQLDGKKYKKVKKGDLKCALEGEDNMIKRAFDLKDKPVILKEPVTDVNTNSDDNSIINPTVLPTLSSNFHHVDEGCSSIKSLTEQPGWVDAIKSEIAGVNFNGTIPDDQVIDRAEQLTKHLKTRFGPHIASRIRDEANAIIGAFDGDERIYRELLSSVLGHPTQKTTLLPSKSMILYLLSISLHL